MTNFKFKLDKAFMGWKGATIPDDLWVILEMRNTRHEMAAALRDLLRLYYYATQEKECDLPIGTGQTIHIRIEDGRTYLHKPPLKILSSFEEIRTQLESLLSDVFAEMDRQGTPEERERQLELLQQKLDQKGERLNVHDIYAHLSE